MFNFNELLSVAEQCRDLQGESEKYVRTGINRAYYSVLMTVKYKAEYIFKYATDIQDSHLHIITKLQKSEDNNLRYLANHLKDLKELRKKADYERLAEVNKPMLIKSIKIAETCFNLCEKADFSKLN